MFSSTLHNTFRLAVPWKRTFIPKLSNSHDCRSYSLYSRHNMSFTTHRDGKGTITVAPKKATDQSALIVITHGLGDSSEGFVDVAEHLAKLLPYAKFVLPTAPTQPVTLNMGMRMASWYDIVGLDERSNEDCKGIVESRRTIEDILQTEHETKGLPYSRMILAGFSQGGALSLFTGLQQPIEKKLAGVVCMSAYLPSAKNFHVTPGLEDTPVLHCHGLADPMVQYTMAEKTKQELLQRGLTKYELKGYRDLQHSVNIDEIGDVTRFIMSILPPDESCNIKLKDPSDMSVKELKAAVKEAGLGDRAKGLVEKSEFVKLVQVHRDGKV
ncbi:hypothetical protein SARC_03936 [Sphaeroforma arctica JP610]|uniref:Phospholipase/carboxylesterase/thioesterase domain-containing protein n=1 Tax=Sphaeroforma arctica JP610 TaxID=667725 RepID=A0A0L0G4K5_9EUKA|nr:hypothetical protein SARC_03936 [Sphaeroforma arctica JP610]KNC83829.1 hypothetical protein SARC_03936 [Sphaeroforma arctica JP610]|eukprot:XP_014157731.1 hypothetical protein SARC_03936 [Sphaeroforma arctica JP610]